MSVWNLFQRREQSLNFALQKNTVNNTWNVMQQLFSKKSRKFLRNFTHISCKTSNFTVLPHHQSADLPMQVIFERKQEAKRFRYPIKHLARCAKSAFQPQIHRHQTWAHFAWNFMLSLCLVISSSKTKVQFWLPVITELVATDAMNE